MNKKPKVIRACNACEATYDQNIMIKSEDGFYFCSECIDELIRGIDEENNE